jgi:hypothetical protein
MFQNRRIGLAFAIVVVLGAVVTYATGRALAAPTCTGCDIVTKVCATNNTGTCTDSPCYQYTNSSQSCWVCGTGSPGGGQCSAGDAALVCQSGSAQIQYQVYQVCTNVCWTNNANKWSDATVALNSTQTFGMETRYVCIEGDG